MTIDRINSLFENGTITAEEHKELINDIVKNKLNSTLSTATLVLSLIGYFTTLVFTKNGHEFSLLDSGNARLWSSSLFSIASIITFIMARNKNKEERLDNHHSYIGLGITISMLLIDIPVIIM